MVAEGRDTFNRFLDILAESLDDHEATPAEFAARAHLSRYHFTRIVKAVSGEPPARFRRRIRLERAAYRILTRDRSLLDEALLAGYASHEAFTRAFQREYGASPSVWRRSPTNFTLAAPSGVHFHPPAGLRVPAEGQARSMDLIVRMVDHHIWLISQMVDRVRQLTDTQLDAPLPLRVEAIDGNSLRWLLSRLIGQMQMWNAALADREYDFGVEDTEPVSQMRRRLDQVAPEFVANVREICATGSFEEMFVEAMSENPKVVTKGGMIAHVLTFSAHHRLLALTTLSAYGIDDLSFGDPKYWIVEGPDN